MGVVNLMNNRRWPALGIMAAVFAAWSYLLLAPIPQLPIGSANGEFANDCCGTITLDNGQMAIGKQYIAYIIETDKRGPYVLTTGYVGVADRGIEINRNGHPLKMYLDARTNPGVITIMSRRGEVQFERVISKGS
jgi:hypothetical protein